MPQSRHNVGTYLETSSHTTCQGTFGRSSQLTEPLWTDSGIKCGISVCKLISTWKRKKKLRRWSNVPTFSQNPCKQGKSHHHSLCSPHWALPWNITSTLYLLYLHHYPSPTWNYARAGPGTLVTVSKSPSDYISPTQNCMSVKSALVYPGVLEKLSRGTFVTTTTSFTLPCVRRS